MRRLLLSLLLVLPAVAAFGQDIDTFLNDVLTKQNKKDAGKAQNLDPKRIINESNSFLKEREPEMTAEEYGSKPRRVEHRGGRT